MSTPRAKRKARSARVLSSPACFLHEFEDEPQARQPGRYPVRIKRIYEAAEAGDGQRVLVDRLWPRGLARERAAVDDWRRAIAPSAALRKWFGHDPARWTEFRRRYAAQLRENRDELEALRAMTRRRPLTLLYAARDPKINHAIVLRDMLLRAR